jgi:hypothetical protein
MDPLKLDSVNKVTTNIERAFDVIPLPSKGLLYTHPMLSGVDKVECFYLTAKEEDILTSPNLIRSGELFDTLLKSILKTKIPVEKLTLGDRNAILIWTRINAYGKDYPVQLQCNACHTEYAHVFDLSSLHIRELTITPDEAGEFVLQLPRSRKIIKIKFMTSEDEKQVYAIESGRAEKLKSKIANGITLRLMRIITEVDAKRDPQSIRDFVENMTIEDSRYVRHFVQDHEPVVIMKQEAVCSNCYTSQEVDIPLTENFFWPDL